MIVFFSRPLLCIKQRSRCGFYCGLVVITKILIRYDRSIYLLSPSTLSVLALHFVQLEACDPKECNPFLCGSGNPIKFHFSNTSTRVQILPIKLEDQERSYVVRSLSYEAQQLVIQDDGLLHLRNTELCNSLHNVTVHFSLFSFLQSCDT